MAGPRLSKLELQILEALWAQGKASIREIQEAFPEPRPAYTTIQTTVYRLEGKNAVRRVGKVPPLYNSLCTHCQDLQSYDCRRHDHRRMQPLRSTTKLSR